MKVKDKVKLTISGMVPIGPKPFWSPSEEGKQEKQSQFQFHCFNNYSQPLKYPQHIRDNTFTSQQSGASICKQA